MTEFERPNSIGQQKNPKSFSYDIIEHFNNIEQTVNTYFTGQLLTEYLASC